MTGGQDVAGGRDVPETTRELEALGVGRIIVCSRGPQRFDRHAGFASGVEVWGRERLAEAESALAATPGVTALVYDQGCAAEARRLWKRGHTAEPRTRVVINEAVCEGCGDCQQKSNCLSLTPTDTPLGRKTQVHQPSCNHDLSCLEGDCPPFLRLVEPPGAERRDKPLPKPPEVPPAAPASVGDTFSIYIVGIGGTGVITLSKLLASAAAAEGWTVSGLDQTGLSQKAGTVVSHIRASRGITPPSNSVSRGGCDLMLALDPLAAAVSQHLDRLDPARSRVLAFESVTATASVIAQPFESLPSAAELDGIIAEHAESVTTCDAERISEALFGDQMPANVLALGVAVQAGLLPLGTAAIEEALAACRGAERNLAAFRWGRAVGADPALGARLVADAAAPVRPPTSRRAETVAERLCRERGLNGEIRAAAEWRAATSSTTRTSAWRRATSTTSPLSPPPSGRPPSTELLLTLAVVANPYKLLAYKDEYEGARLHLWPEFRAWIGREHEGARLRFMLHPPALRSLGMRRKIALPPSVALPTFRALRAMRRLRGTRLDPFGGAEVRRTERRLVAEYRAALRRLVATLDDDTHHRAVEIAELPGLVRGYEQVKLDNVTRFRQRLAESLATL